MLPPKAAQQIDPPSSPYALRNAGLLPHTRPSVVRFVGKNYRRVHAYLKSVIERIDPPRFPGTSDDSCLLGRLVPDDKVIADFRKDNGPAIRRV